MLNDMQLKWTRAVGIWSWSMPSNRDLKRQLDKYDAIMLRVEMSDYGYWRVTYSVAPGVYLPVTVCENGITSAEAVTRANAVVAATTQQVVTS